MHVDQGLYLEIKQFEDVFFSVMMAGSVSHYPSMLTINRYILSLPTPSVPRIPQLSLEHIPPIIQSQR